MRSLFLWGLLLVQLTACAPFSKQDLAGAWQGLSLTEETDSVAIDPALVRFSFDENGRYSFQSTLNYREAGHYRLRRQYLLTRDTLRLAEEKAVEVQKLTPDSLVIRMMNEGRERILVLGKMELE